MATEEPVTEKSETIEPKEDTQQSYKKLYRLPKDGKIAGVCAGLADYFVMDVTLLRVVFVVLTLASGGFGLLLYLILAVVMPTDETRSIASAGKTDFGENVRNLTEDIRANGSTDKLRNLFGLALVLLGAWLLLVQLFPQWLNMNWDILWPALLILLGILFVAGSRK